jgi:hypothetical protein
MFTTRPFPTPEPKKLKKLKSPRVLFEKKATENQLVAVWGSRAGQSSVSVYLFSNVPERSRY